MHHVKHIRKRYPDSIEKIMSNLNRKQIPVCHACHMKIHSGKFEKVLVNYVRISSNTHNKTQRAVCGESCTYGSEGGYSLPVHGEHGSRCG